MQSIAMTMTTNYRGWFARWFDTSFYQKLYANRNESEAANFIDLLVNELQPESKARMLDLGCGAGRHSKYLSLKGFDVTGIDLSSLSIRQAKKWEGPSLKFYRQDMRMPFGNKVFDYVFNFFTSFGYFDDPDDDDRVIQNITSSLKPGGLLVMDYINAPYAEKKLVSHETKEIDGILYRITRWTNETHFFKKIIIDEPLFGQPLEYIEQVRKFSLREFDELYRNNGLKIIDCFGDYQLNGYDKDNSPRIILLARKS